MEEQHPLSRVEERKVLTQLRSIYESYLRFINSRIEEIDKNTD